MSSAIARLRVVVRSAAITYGLALSVFASAAADAQGHAHSPEDINSALHMEMTALRPGTAADSARAAGVARILRDALKQYADTSTAVADGYTMFNPTDTHQKTYHFTSNWNALKEAFRFDPAKPTSLLYRKDASGHFVLTGAMYSAPRKFSPEKLDVRVPLSIAQWHKHVNWCIPKKADKVRWAESKDGYAVFGPASPIATKRACDAVGGVFHETVFGWMVHANVMAGDDPKLIWSDDHMAHDMKDMHDGMKMGVDP